MALLILCDPKYRNNSWCDTKLRGIYDEAARRRISVKMYTDLEGFEHDAAKLGRDSSVILLFNSMKYLSDAAQVLEKLAIHPILSMTESNISFPRSYSRVCGDNDSATKEVVDYLSSMGKKKVALLGASKNSAASLNKEEVLRRYVSPENYGIFYLENNLLESFDAFFEKKDEYDAAICIDDNQAICLMEYLLSRGAYNPEQYIISYGDTIISRLYKIGLSTVSTGFYDCGRAMVEAHICREKYNWSSTLIRVNCEFKVRESANSTANVDYQAATVPLTTARVARFERTLSLCDLIDLKILYGVLCGYGYEQICEFCFLSYGAVKYRVRQMRVRFGCEDRVNMIETVTSLIDKNKLLTLIETLEGSCKSIDAF